MSLHQFSVDIYVCMSLHKFIVDIYVYESPSG